MGSKMPSRKGDGAGTRRDEILRCAAEIFAAKGVGQTSIEDIAQAVGVKREAIYYYFKGRNEILAEIVLPQSEQLLVQIREILDSKLTYPEKLKAAVLRHVDSLTIGYLELTLAMRELALINEDEKLDDLRSMWKTYTDLWADLVRQGQADGSLREGLDPKMVSFGIIGMLNWVNRWYQPGKGASREEIAETYAALAMNGLVKG